MGACALIGSLVSNEILGLEIGKKLIFVTVLIVIFGGAWISAKKAPCERLVVSVLTTSGSLAALLMIKLFFMHGVVLPGRICITALMSLPAAVLASRKKERKR